MIELNEFRFLEIPVIRIFSGKLYQKMEGPLYEDGFFEADFDGLKVIISQTKFRII